MPDCKYPENDEVVRSAISEYSTHFRGVKFDPGLALDQGGGYLHDDGLDGVCGAPALEDKML